MKRLSLLNPSVDYVFKKIFGRDKALCAALISSILGWKAHTILEFEFIDKELLPDSVEGKEGRLDVLIKLHDGRQINIEIQVSRQDEYAQRTLFYWSSLYTQQISKGDGYGDLKPVICINILMHNYFTQYPDYHNEFALAHTGGLKCPDKLNHLSLHFLELSKFNEDKLEDDCDEWCLFFKNPEKRVKTVFNNDMLKKAVEELERLSQNPEERRYYDVRLKALRDKDAELRTSFDAGLREGIEKGLQEGIEKGLQEGIEKGLQEGIEKGLHEGIEKGLQEGIEKGLQEGIEKGLQEGIEKGQHALVKNMYANGVSLEMIAKFTDFSLDQVKAILEL